MIELAPAFYWRQMTTSQGWELWEGSGFRPSRSNSAIYYHPGKINIEDQDQLDKLALEIRVDGVTPDLSSAYVVLEDAIVTHGHTVMFEGELSYYTEEGDEFEDTRAATWVEVDEYDD